MGSEFVQQGNIHRSEAADRMRVSALDIRAVAPFISVR